MRPKDQPGASAPRADDVVLFDGVTNGVRGLSASWFDATFARASEVKPLRATGGVFLTDNGTTITISTYPKNQSADDMESYPVGAAPTLYAGYGWSSYGTTLVFEYPWAVDAFEDYGVGAITSLTGGSGWAASGILTTV